MKIDLRQTRTLVISCADQHERRRNILAQLASVDMKCEFMDGIQCQPGIIGCGLSHLRLLMRFADRLPLLVLEDDCSVTTAFRPTLELPDEAEVVYLGVSVWGVFPESHPDAIPLGAIATRYDPNWLRLHNMTSAHAVLYLSPDMVQAAQGNIVQSLADNRPFDMRFALLQRQFLTLTPNEPYFYQDGRFRGAEQSTKQRLVPVNSPSEVTIARDGNTINVSRPMPACQPM